MPQSHIKDFPHDIIEKNGAQIFDLLFYLSGDKSTARLKFDENIKRVDKIKKLIK